ncbi:MAG: hypothetical protein N2484_15710 [Clostridia bacterium]|nr:hypothetical protein [Clostridia bacterium]
MYFSYPDLEVVKISSMHAESFYDSYTYILCGFSPNKSGYKELEGISKRILLQNANSIESP